MGNMKSLLSLISALTRLVRPLRCGNFILVNLVRGLCAWGAIRSTNASVLRRICYASGMLQLSTFGVAQRLLARHALKRWANVGSLAFMLGCGASQKAHDAPKSQPPSTVALAPTAFEEWVESTGRLKEIMYDWSAEPVSATGPCTWAGVWRNRAGPPPDYVLVSDAGVTVYGNRLLASEIAITEATPPRLSVTSMWPVRGRFTTQGPLSVRLNRQVDFVPEHVWVDAHGSVEVRGRAENSVTIGFRGVSSKEVACSDVTLAEFPLPPREGLEPSIDGHIRDFALHTAPEGEIVLRDETATLPPALQTTTEVAVLEREGTWVRVKDAASAYHHFDGWVRADSFVAEPFHAMWGGYHTVVEPTHRTIEVTELYDAQRRVPLGMEVASGVPIALLSPPEGEFVAVALPGIIAKDPASFYIPKSAIAANQ